jgi:GGDEF domain-containing protein
VFEARRGTQPSAHAHEYCAISDIETVESKETNALIRITQSRFRSFSEAAEAVLGALAEVVPGSLVLGEIDSYERACRVIGVDGDSIEGVHPGAALPLGSPPNGDAADRGAPGPPRNSEIDQAFLDSLGVSACIGIPLEMSNGRIVATLSALDPDPDAYRWENVAVLSLAARLLSHEWESVERRAEIRRLRGSLAEGSKLDPETQILNREGFLDVVDHDWRLAERGTVESVLIAFRVGDDSGSGDGAGTTLALKVTAEVLEGSVRATDRVGRVGDATLAVSLVGCGVEQAPVFVERFRATLGRVTRDGHPTVELAHGIQQLRGVSSAREAVELADLAAGQAAQLDRRAEPTMQEVAE